MAEGSHPTATSSPAEHETETSDLDQQKKIAEINKLEAECVKLKLDTNKLNIETQLLQRQVSRSGKLQEWFKAGAAPAALLGVIFSYLIGSAQVSQQGETRNVDRFEKGIARLTSINPSERIQGINSLNELLVENNQIYKHVVLNRLATAVQGEKSPEVLERIRETFDNLPLVTVNKKSLDSILKLATENNRALVRKINKNTDQLIGDRRRKKFDELLDKYSVGGNSPESIIYNYSIIIDPQLANKISDGELRQLIADHRTRYDELKDNINLHVFSKIITSVLRAGADYKIIDGNFSGIFCQECDFSGVRDLSNSHFDQAYLKDADFSFVNLSGSTFHNADLSGTVLFSSNLSNARLNREKASDDALDISDAAKFVDRIVAFPLFACATLAGANLSGIIMAQIDYWTGMQGNERFSFQAPLFTGKISNSVMMDNFRVAATMRRRIETLSYGVNSFTEFLAPDADSIVMNKQEKEPSALLVSSAATERRSVDLVAGRLQHIDIDSSNITMMKPIFLPAMRKYFSETGLATTRSVSAILGTSIARARTGAMDFSAKYDSSLDCKTSTKIDRDRLYIRF